MRKCGLENAEGPVWRVTQPSCSHTPPHCHPGSLSIPLQQPPGFVGLKGCRAAPFLSPTSPRDRMTLDEILPFVMRDEKIVRERLEQLRGQFLQWGTPELPVLVTTKDELRGWIRALEWVLRKTSGDP